MFHHPGDLRQRLSFEAPTLRMGASLHPKFKGKVMPPKDMPKWFLGQQKKCQVPLPSFYWGPHAFQSVRTIGGGQLVNKIGDKTLRFSSSFADGLPSRILGEKKECKTSFPSLGTRPFPLKEYVVGLRTPPTICPTFFSGNLWKSGEIFSDFAYNIILVGISPIKTRTPRLVRISKRMQHILLITIL